MAVRRLIACVPQTIVWVVFMSAATLFVSRGHADAQEIVAVAGGGSHSIARDACGGVWAWGGNGTGQLGDGTRTARPTPIRVATILRAVRAISASGASYAILSDGTIMAWGPNNVGQLGLGTVSVDVLVPTSIPGLAGVTAVAAGGNHALALVGGEVYAWGANNEGQLGVGTIDVIAHETPLKVAGLPNIVAIAASRNNDSYALDSNGFVWAWGRNTVGQVGRSTGGTPQAMPVRVLRSLISTDPLDGVIAIAANNGSAAALRQDGTVWTWGFNSNGQLGDGTLTNRAFAAPVQESSGGSLGNILTISGGTFFFLASRADGSARGWGQNANGQLGDGTTTDRHRAVLVMTNTAAPLTGVASVAAGGSHSHALMTDGTLRSWGAKGSGQLGNGTFSPFQTFPVAVSEPSTGQLVGVDTIFAGGAMSGALLGSTGRAWGANSFGQIGDGSTQNRLTPVSVPGLDGTTRAAAGGAHTLALQSDATARAWGLGTTGQLGNGTSLSSLIPVQVMGLDSVSAVSAAGQHSMALSTDGTVWSWGLNSTGQLGDGTTVNRMSPVQVRTSAIGVLTNVRRISASASFSLALREDGSAWAWGQNNLGQLGDGTSATARVFPAQVLTATGPLMGIGAIASGAAHSLALGADGTVWTWGQNNFGQLGDGTTTDRRAAAQVVGLTDIVAIAAGSSFSLALRGDGTVWAWGFNGQGQLADGSATNRSLPGAVKRDPGTLFTDVTAIVAGSAHALALTNDGHVWSWGSNDSGQLGDGSDPNEVFAVPVAFPLRDLPTATLTATPNRLWPANNKLVPVTIVVSASDSCTGSPAVELASVTNNEAANGSDIGTITRAGNTWTVLLRATRSGRGSGRVYTARFSITDAAGNQSSVSTTIVVPHSALP